MRDKTENTIIEKVIKQTKDYLFEKLSSYNYLTINDILIIRHAILDKVVEQKDIFEILDTSESVDNVKDFIQKNYALFNTQI